MKKLSYMEQIKSLSKAKCCLIWTATNEEQRAESQLLQTAAALQMLPYTWTVTAGLYSHINKTADQNKANLLTILNGTAANAPERQMIIIKDPEAQIGQAGILRFLKDEQTAGRTRDRERQKLYVFISQKPAPSEITGIMKINLELPDRAEQEQLLNLALMGNNMEIDAETRAANLDALTGLDSPTAYNALMKSLVNTGTISPEYIAQEKKQYIQNGSLQWIDSDPRGLDAIGGLEVLKEDLIKTRAAMSGEATSWGVPSPKGILIVGIPGSGKSLTAKAVAAAYRLPLIKFNISALLGKYQGESEQNMRQALAIMDAVSPAIIWIDEIEKAFAGAGGTGETDGGTTTRIFGDFLTWTQERQGKLFLIATANDVSKLPIELKRAGRFDRIYFTDTPHAIEAEAIARIMQTKHPRTANTDAKRIAAAANGYTGAEIERAFEDALNTAYTDGQREITTEDIINGLATITPICKMDSTKIEALRQWARTGARPASRAPEMSVSDKAQEFKI